MSKPLPELIRPDTRQATGSGTVHLMSSIGYARVSTALQDTAAQTDALAACLDYLREGDTLVL